MKKIITHPGAPHPDETFAVALAIILFGDVEVERREVAEDEDPDADFVLDVGGRYDGEKFFDHHQKNAPTAEDGTPHCSLTLFAEKFLPKDVVQELWESGFQRIATADNGANPKKGVPNVSGWVCAFYPSWDEKEPDYDKAFWEIVHAALPLLRKMIEKAKSTIRARECWGELARENGCLLCMKTMVEWRVVAEKVEKKPWLKYALYPSKRHGYSIQCLPKDKVNLKSKRKPLPTRWLDDPPKGMVFCHKALHMASFIDEATAVNAILSAIKKERRKYAVFAKQKKGRK